MWEYQTESGSLQNRILYCRYLATEVGDSTFLGERSGKKVKSLSYFGGTHTYLGGSFSKKVKRLSYFGGTLSNLGGTLTYLGRAPPK